MEFMSEEKKSKFVSAMFHSDTIINKQDFKICKECGENKEIKDFSKTIRNADGRCTCCKKCRTKSASAVYHKRKDERDFYKSMMPI
jgi:hypothetical protein